MSLWFKRGKRLYSVSVPLLPVLALVGLIVAVVLPIVFRLFW